MKPPAIALAAVVGYVAAFAVAMIAWQRVDAERSAADMDRFGVALARDLAHLAVDPLMRQDRVGLGLLAKRMAERAQVERIAVYTLDGQPFIVVGDSVARDSRPYTQPVAVEDSVVGDVRVTLNRAAFGLPAQRLAATTWWYWLAGLALLAAGAYGCAAVLVRRRSAKPADEERDAYLLVANLFRRVPMSDDERRAAIERSLAIAGLIAARFRGEAAELPNTGLVMVFADTDRPERAFEAVCAALLLRRLSSIVTPFETRGDDETAFVAVPFRYALDLAYRLPRSVEDPLLAKAKPVRGVTLLSALAPDGGLVLGETARASIERAERLLLDPFDNPAAKLLSADAATPGGIVRGVASSEQAWLDEEEQAIADDLREQAVHGGERGLH